MNTVASHKHLPVWHKAIALASEVYALAKELPSDEASLADQLRQSAVAVACHIADGAARHTQAGLVDSLRRAQAALYQLETRLWIAAEQMQSPRMKQALNEVAEVGRFLTLRLRSLHQSGLHAHAKACAPSHLGSIRS